MKRDPNCTMCALHASTKTRCVWGIGPERSDVMLVGEAPGYHEAETGKPFQGPSGKLLREQLAKVGIDPETVYITNMAKCRPPENRSPTDSEIKTCRPYLLEEITQVQPKFVGLLGATALKLIKKTGITTLRGSTFEVDGIKYMPMFHPAVGLRDPGKLPAIQQDLAKFARMIKGELATVDVSWRIVTPRNWRIFLREFSECKAFAFDAETTGLFVHDPDFRVNCVSFTLDSGQTWVLALMKNDDPVWAAQVLMQVHEASIGKRAIAHNGKFDNMALRARYSVRFDLATDTMLVSHVFDENSPHDLKFLAKIHCEAPDYDDLTLKEKQGRTGDFQRVLKYNAYDTYYTYRLHEHYLDKLRRNAALRRLFTRLVMPAARIVETADFEGHYIRLDQFEKTRVELKEKAVQAERDLNSMVRGVQRRKVNWGSPQQVADVLFNRLSLPSHHTTGTGKPSTDEEALLDLKGLHPIADKLIEFRHWQKFLSTYIEGWDELMIGNYLYLSTKMHGTVTGRYSSRLHQVPRDGTIRNLFSAPDPFVFVCADFSQIELRLVADASQDPLMKMIFQTGGDIHVETAMSVMGITREPTKAERKSAKAVNFGYVYGMGWLKFKQYARMKYDVHLTDDEAKQFRNRFFERYAGLEPWHDRVRRRVRHDGYVQYLSGRLRRLPGVFSNNKEIRAESERQAINSPIQGFGSGDLKAMAMVGIVEEFPDPDVLRIKGEVHDSILMWVRESEVPRVIPRIKAIMERPPLFDAFQIELSIPLIVDVEIGPWGAGVKY